MASDKGWNDPPVMSYSVASSTRTKKSNLTKRVAFPNSGIHDKPIIASSVPSAPPVLLPGTSETNVDETLHVKEIDASSCSQDVNVDEDMHKKTVDTLNHCLSRLNTLQKNEEADVGRRIELFSRMWSEGKLDSDVQMKMYQCSVALWNGDYSKADSIHLNLMVDHCNQVSSWMVAIKRLIRECKKHNAHLMNSECPIISKSESADVKD